jgi:hypothetical protein
MPPPYAPLTPSPPYAQVMRRGWTIGRNPAIDVTQPMPWDLARTGERSWVFHFLSLDQIDPLLVEYAETGDREPLNRAIAISLDWWRTRDQRDEAGDWYDMAVGSRAWRISYALEAAREEGLSISRRRELSECLAEHERRLMPDEAFTAGSNHGFFQAAGQMAIGDGPFRRDPKTRAVALSRLMMILDTHFSSEGVHREHSPDYHYFLQRGFEALRTRNLLPGKTAARRLAQISKSLTWFITPQGHIANFGDSDNRPLKPEERAALPPMGQGFMTYPEAGYAILRVGKGLRGGYLAQTLCYHSRVHKQADDLSVIWHARGTQVLIDAGRLRYGKRPDGGSKLEKQGYRYADPRRVFCESIQAHNTLQIDGAQDARQGSAYGSALEASARTGGIAATLGRVKRKPFTHTRLVLGDGTGWLVLIDGVAGGLMAPQVRQWHHMGPEWKLGVSRDGFDALSSGQRVSLTPLTPARPEGPFLSVEPDYQGWWSPRANVFEPAPAAAFARRGRLVGSALAFDGAAPRLIDMRLDARLEGAVSLALADGRRLDVRIQRGTLEMDVKDAVS